MVETADGPVPIAGARPRLVLAMLLVERNRVVSPDRLAEELWGDEQPGDAAAAVRTHVFRLRKQLGALAADLDTADGGYVLRVAPDGTDAAVFEAGLAAASGDPDPASAAGRLAGLLGLWRGPALADVADRPFARPEAVRLEALRGGAVEAYAGALLTAGRAGDAVVELERFLAAEPEREHARALLMEALYRSGRQTDALAVYRTWCDQLSDRGLDPGPELRRLESAILRHALPTRGATAPTPPTPPAPAVPAVPGGADGEPAPGRVVSGPILPATSFVGRGGDVEAVAELLGRARVVTIVGPGGVGKTRLSLHTAAAAAQQFPDGVVVCDLAPVTDQVGVWRALAQPLGVEEHTGTSLDQRIAEVLASQQALLVLDNCEQVVDVVAALVDTLVRRTSHTRVLATSRERLAVDGEHLWPVAPLGTRGPDAPARRLFADRARAADPRLPADLEDHPAVEEIVARLDGLPLAIELAAARCATLSVEDVAAALQDRFGLLTGGVRTTPRHRSLGAVVQWSYDLLDGEERRVFEELSVFAGRFDLAAARAVTGIAGPPAGSGVAAQPVETVLRLAERSLLLRHHGPTTRFSMLESLREFGRRRLTERNGLDAAGARHAQHLVSVAARAARLLQGPDEAVGVALVTAHLEEFRAAQAWLRDHDPVAGLALVADLRLYAMFRISSEVYAWTEAMAEAHGGVHPGAGADDLPLVLGSAAQGAWFRGDFARARALAEAGVAAAGSRPVLARLAFQAQGDIALLDGKLDEAAARYQDAVEQFGAADEPVEVVAAEAGGAALALAYSGHVDAALARARESLQLAESTGVPSALAFAHFGMAEVATCGGDMAAAERHARQALALAAPVECRFVLGIAGVTLASLLCRTGRAAEACARYRDVVSVFHRSGTWTPQWVALRTVVDLLEQAGNATGAAVLLGAITASPTAAPAYGTDAERLDSIRSRLGATLGPDEVARLAAEGAALGDDAAIGHAIRALDAVLASS